MKITYRVGDLLTAPEPLIAHGCNAQGVMGSGVALAIKTKWPEVFAAYEKAHNEKGLQLGQVVWAATKGKPRRLVANCITQELYGRDGRRYVNYVAVRACMAFINKGAANVEGGYGMAMPMIGAGLGGGDWHEIAAIIESELRSIKPVVYVLTPDQLPDDLRGEVQPH